MSILISSIINITVSTAVILAMIFGLLPQRGELFVAGYLIFGLLSILTPTGMTSWLSQVFLALAIGCFVTVSEIFLVKGFGGVPPTIERLPAEERTIVIALAMPFYWITTLLVFTYLRGGAFRVWRLIRRHRLHNPPQTEREKWLLAISALYAETNGDAFLMRGKPFWLMDMGHASLKAAKGCRWAIRRDWGVRRRGDLEQRLNMLLREGHRQQMRPIANRRAREEGWPWPPDKSGRPMGTSLLGWDMLRFGNLVRMAYAAGVIRSSEAWDWLDKSGVLVRLQSQSWKELLIDWQAGLMIWSNDPGYLDIYRATIKRLLSDPQSPYVAIPFR